MKYHYIYELNGVKMKVFKKIVLLSILSTTLGQTSEAVIVKFETTNPRIKFADYISTYDDDSKNTFLKQYTV